MHFFSSVPPLVFEKLASPQFQPSLTYGKKLLFLKNWEIISIFEKLFLFPFFTAMTMFHQGTDAAAFEYVKVMSPEGKTYHCDFPIQLIDNEDYLSTIECQEG